jgi:hypothetical protein
MELSDQLIADDSVANKSLDEDELHKWDALLADWSPDSFQYVVDLARESPVIAKSLFSRFGWELFDKVVDYSLSAFSEDTLFETVKLIGINCRPRELYMMVVEKLAGEGFSNEPSGLSILLIAMQIALNELSSPLFLRDGLSTVLKAVIDCSANVKVTSDADCDDRKPIDDSRQSTYMKIAEIALNFCECVATR